jgi:hypothetical protein
MTGDLHSNTGAMALGALPDGEAAEYSEHLQSCHACTAELAGFLETAAILGSSAAQTPPAGLRRSVMEAVSRTAQLPPLTTAPATADTFLGRHRVNAPAPAAPVSEQLATVIPLRRPWYRRPQAFLAAAIAVLVIAGGLTITLGNRTSTPPSAGACVAAASDKSVLSPTVGAGGDATFSPSCDAVAINMPALPAAPTGKVYQVWVVKGSNPNASSVQVMNSNAGGAAAVVGTKVHAGDTAVAVTLEPAPGSVRPTTAPFWMVPLTA